MSSTAIACSIVIPVYNEEAAVAGALERILRIFASAPFATEFVVVNDGSSDGTAAALARFEGRPNMTILHHPVNLGKGAALRTGIARASGDAIAFCDADHELDPVDLLRLIGILISGNRPGNRSVIYGRRRFPSGGGFHTLLFGLGNRLLNFTGNMLFLGHVVDMECGYKVFRGQVIRSLPLRCRRFDIEPEVTYSLLARGFRIDQFPIFYRPRTHAMGKKIRARDGLAAILTMIRIRLMS